MDTNEIINQLREENERIAKDNHQLCKKIIDIIIAAREIGYSNDGVEFGAVNYLIETARATAMVNQKNVELQAQLVAVQDSVVHGKCSNSEPCATFCEAIATRKMFKQLQVERDAYQKLADSMEALMVKHKRVFTSKELKGAESHLAFHDAEVASKAIDYNVIKKECSMYFDDSTTYADELATAIFNKLTEKAKAVSPVVAGKCLACGEDHGSTNLPCPKWPVTS